MQLSIENVGRMGQYAVCRAPVHKGSTYWLRISGGSITLSCPLCAAAAKELEEKAGAVQ